MIRAIAVFCAATVLVAINVWAEEISLKPAGPAANSSPAIPLTITEQGVVAKNKRVYVNGSIFFIKGVAYNLSTAGQFSSIKASFPLTPLSVLDNDFKMMKEAGINTIKTYEPLPDVMLDLADKYDIKIIEQIICPTAYTNYSSEFELNVLKKMAVDIVEKQKNRRCILMWSIWNDAPFCHEKPGSPVSRYGFNTVTNFFKEIYLAIKAVDKNHPVTAANITKVKDFELGFDFLDVIGCNVYLGGHGFSWRGKASALNTVKELKELSEKYDKPVIVTETGYSSFVKKETQDKALAIQIKSVDEDLSGIVIFEWMDGWWKAGNPYAQDPQVEEYWGILTLDRKLKPGFLAVSKFFNLIPTNSLGYPKEKVEEGNEEPEGGSEPAEEPAKDLIDAVQKGDSSAVRDFLAKGANINAKDDTGRTALIYALKEGYIGIAKELIAKNADVNVKDNDGVTVLIYAAKQGYLDIVKDFLAKGADANAKDGGKATALIYVSSLGNFDIMQLLISKGADVNARNNDGQTPLMLASQSGQLKAVSLLLDNGAGVNVRNNFGQTALRYALKDGYIDIAQLLISKGADVNSRDSVNCTALMWASQNGRPDTIEMLLSKGADVSTRDNSEATSLMWASQNGNPKVIQLLLSKGADVDAKDNVGQTALMWASQSRNIDAMKLLLEKGADMDVKDKNGDTALSLAKNKGYNDAIQMLNKVRRQRDDAKNQLIYAAQRGDLAAVKELLAKGAEINAKDNIFGNTALMWASMRGHIEAVKELIAKGADINAKGNDGSTALSLAKAKGHNEVAQVLIEAGAKE